MTNNTTDRLAERCIDRLETGRTAPKEARAALLATGRRETVERLFAAAEATAGRHFNRGVYLRGLIEISSHCRNNCYYCGLRRSNAFAERYRLSREEILECCRRGHALGLRTFVLQGGEDEVQDDDWLADTVGAIREAFPQAAITLSVGERSEEAYRRFRLAGADRYLLRHETRDDLHYARLHPASMSAAKRRECLFTLRRLGYQTGAGMMVGSPGQTAEHLLEDLEFLEELRPQMIGVGPFIPAPHTPFAREAAGSVELTLRLVAVLRLLFPQALIPATTALNTLDAHGHERGIRAGANVLMPNLSPPDVRGKYAIYRRKACTGNEAAEAIRDIEQQLHNIGYHIAPGRGDFPQHETTCTTHVPTGQRSLSATEK